MTVSINSQTAGGGFGTFPTNYLPFENYKFQGDALQATVEAFNLVKNTTKTLINVSGYGVVESVDLITDWTQLLTLGSLDIYIDGGAAINIQFNSLGIYSYYPTTNINYYTPHLRFAFGITGPHLVFTYPIPYTKSIRIDWNSTGSTNDFATIWANIQYRPNVLCPWKFGYSGLSYANRILQITPTNQGNRTLQMLNLPSGTAGMIAGVSMCFTNSSDLSTKNSYLENNIVLYSGPQPKDGSVVPVYNTTGVEDFFKNQFYFENGEGNFNDVMVTSFNRSGVNSANTSVHRDFIAWDGGLTFSNGCLLTMETGLTPGSISPTTNIDVFYGVIYYTK
jgi:hypothetical protein